VKTTGLEDESVAVVAMRWLRKAQKMRRTVADFAQEDETGW
jgi:hypothetical protein